MIKNYPFKVGKDKLAYTHIVNIDFNKSNIRFIREAQLFGAWYSNLKLNFGATASNLRLFIGIKK